MRPRKWPRPAWRRGARPSWTGTGLERLQLQRSGHAAHLLRLHLSHLGARALETVLVPDLADLREDGAFLFLDVVLEGGVHFLHLAEPYRLVGPEAADGLEEAAHLLHLSLMLLPPLRELLVLRRGIARERLVEAGVLDLLVELELRRELLPEPASLLRGSLENLVERCLGLLVLLFQELDRIHGIASSDWCR